MPVSSSRPRFTTTGRVVYDRKKHVWKQRDLVRICTRFSEVQGINALPGIVSMVVGQRLSEGSLGFWEALGFAFGQIQGTTDFAVDPRLLLVPDQETFKAFWAQGPSLETEFRRRVAASMRSNADTIEGE